MLRTVFITIILVLLLGTIFCSRNPDSSVLNDIVTLNYGQSVIFGPDKIKIKFDSLLTESRCPDHPLIKCFWQGMAAIQLALITPDDDTVLIVTSIEGFTKYPEHDSYPAVDTLGLSIELIELYPYPGSDEPIPLSQYRATLRIKTSIADNGLDGRLLIIDGDPLNLLRDDYEIDSAFIEDDILTLKVAYGGGCKTHYFFAYVPNFIYLSNPPQMDLYLHHFGNNDMCEAYIHRDLKFDLLPLADNFKNIEPDGYDIIIRLNELSDGVPSLKSSILYHIN